MTKKRDGSVIVVGAVAAAGVAAEAALEMIGRGEDQVGTVEVEVFGVELCGRLGRVWLGHG
jgi:hypothetical protein